MCLCVSACLCLCVSVCVCVASHSLSSRLRDDTLEFLIGSGSGEFDFDSGWTQEMTFTQNLTEISGNKNNGGLQKTQAMKLWDIEWLN